MASVGQLGSPSRFTCASTSSLFFGAAMVVGDSSPAAPASPEEGVLASAFPLAEMAPVGFLPAATGFAVGFGAIACGLAALECAEGPRCRTKPRLSAFFCASESPKSLLESAPMHDQVENCYFEGGAGGRGRGRGLQNFSRRRNRLTAARRRPPGSYDFARPIVRLCPAGLVLLLLHL